MAINEQELLKKYWDIIKEEVNVKEISSFSSDKPLVKIFKPLGSQLSAKFWKDTGQIIANGKQWNIKELDNGQVEVSKLLSSVFNAFLANPIFRKVMPSDYKLFQVADFICTMELVTLKLNNKLFSKSELNFFGNERDLKQNYLKALKKKEWK